MKLGVLIAFGIAVLPSLAAAADLKVAVVDIRKVVTTSQAGSAAQKDYEKEVKGARARLDVKKKELESQQQAFQKAKDSLSGKARSEREDTLLGLEKEFRRSVQDTEEQLRKKNGQLLGELFKRVRTVVNDIGKKGDYSLILEKGDNSVLFAESGLDITNEVIERLNDAE
jgi:outer membrane protein